MYKSKRNEFSLDLLKVGNLVQFKNGETMRVVNLNNKISLMDYEGNIYDIKKSDDKTNYIMIRKLGKPCGMQFKIIKVFLNNGDENFNEISTLGIDRLILWEDEDFKLKEDYLAEWKKLDYDVTIRAINRDKYGFNVIGSFFGVEERTVANKKYDSILLRVKKDGMDEIKNLPFSQYDFEIIKEIKMIRSDK